MRDEPLFSQVAVKFSLLVSEETLSSGSPLAGTMLMAVGLKLPIADPLAVTPVKFTVPKSASGRMPPLLVQQGASAITSAEDLGAPESVFVTVWLQPSVVSASVRVKLLLPV